MAAICRDVHFCRGSKTEPDCSCCRLLRKNSDEAVTRHTTAEMVVTHKINIIVMGNQAGTFPPDIRNPTAVTKNMTTKADVTNPARSDVFGMRVM
jgi:hypothetical protein